MAKWQGLIKDGVMYSSGSALQLEKSKQMVLQYREKAKAHGGVGLRWALPWGVEWSLGPGGSASLSLEELSKVNVITHQCFMPEGR